VQIECSGDAAGPTSIFKGDANILLGDGDDTLKIGLTGQAGNTADFRQLAVFDGGAGTDTFTDASNNRYVTEPYLYHFEP
jgi:hypothetical protein